LSATSQSAVLATAKIYGVFLKHLMLLQHEMYLTLIHPSCCIEHIWSHANRDNVGSLQNWTQGRQEGESRASALLRNVQNEMQQHKDLLAELRTIHRSPVHQPRERQVWHISDYCTDCRYRACLLQVCELLQQWLCIMLHVLVVCQDHT
jgi:hypothetical protein